MGKYATHSFEVSRKILCILLTGVLMLQTGCQTTKVLMTLEDQDLQTKHETADQQPLRLKKEQLLRVTIIGLYKGLYKRSEPLVGRVKSVTLDAIVITDKDKDIRISFEHIKKIELMTVVEKKKYIVAAVVCAIPVLILLYFLANPIHLN